MWVSNFISMGVLVSLLIYECPGFEPLIYGCPGLEQRVYPCVGMKFSVFRTSLAFDEIYGARGI